MTEYYIDPADGTDSNSGTSTSGAWASFGPVDRWDGPVSLTGGDTVYVRDTAVVTEDVVDLRGYAGTADKPITVTNYQSEAPVVDLSDGSSHGVRLDATEHVVVENLEIRRAARHNIRANRAVETTVRNCRIHAHGRGGDFGAGVAVRGSEADGVKIHDCEIYDGAAGGNSDGIVAGEGPRNLEIKRCNIHHNSDDGVDLKGKNGPPKPALLEDVVCWENGHDLDNTASGNGNGFKFGDTSYDSGGHTFVRCIAYNNDHRGIGNPGANLPVTLYNCVAIDNGSPNIWLTTDGVEHEVVNCISQGSDGWDCKIDSSAAIVKTCNWDESQRDDFNATDGDGIEVSFRSKDPSSSDFLRLPSGSPAIDAGTDVGLAFSGAAPDWGAFESEDTSEPAPGEDGTDTTSAPTLKVYTGTEWVQVN